MSKLLYATRSFLPSPTANAVQSANMAVAFSRHFPETLVSYRTSTDTANTKDHFAPFGLTPPPACHAIRDFPPLEHSHFYLLAFLRFFKKQAPNTLVYTRSARLSWVATQAGLPCVIELHDPLIPIRARWLHRLQRSKRLPGIVATTARLRDDLAETLGLPPERILVAGGAACSHQAKIPPSGGERTATFNVGYAGSALPGKGVKQVIACARAIPEYSFHLIGPSPKDCAHGQALPSNLLFHGRLTSPEVMARIKNMDALLLPNQRSVIIRSGADIGEHTSPLKLFEYLASGRPIVASDLPVFKDILTHEENALLTAPEDTAGFCAALRRLHSETNLGPTLGANARRDFLAHYTWDKRAERILAFLRSLELLS